MRIANIALWAVLLVGLMVCSALTCGCTQGQLAPAAMKNCVYASVADLQVTAVQARQAAATQPADPIRDRLLAACDRVAGRPSDPNGLLYPVKCWFQGVKP